MVAPVDPSPTPSHAHAMNLDRTLSVEGNIGSGKSTFLRTIAPLVERILQARDKTATVHVLWEPIDSWKNVGPNEVNVLAEFYKNPKIAYEFQTIAFTTRLTAYQELTKRMHPTDVAIIERSVFGDHTMAENCHTTGLLSDIQMACYEGVFQNLLRLYPHRPAGHIYIDTPPDICIKRIIERKRPEEACITDTLAQPPSSDDTDREKYAYIYSIDEAHKRNFARVTSKRNGIPILHIDGAPAFHDNVTVQLDYARKVVDFLDSLEPSSNA